MIEGVREAEAESEGGTQDDRLQFFVARELRGESGEEGLLSKTTFDVDGCWFVASSKAMGVCDVEIGV